MTRGRRDAHRPARRSERTVPTPADPPSGAPADLAGGRYRLGEEIAGGGMGVVYSAHDTWLDRAVAVKSLRHWLPDDTAGFRRFTDEAKIAGRLQHPGIPPIHDLGALSDGRPFLAMKLIRGRTLDALLKERATPDADRGRFVAIFEAIAQAVGYAHAQGVIHRDLKPANVMVGAFGEVQVMDWGLAKVLASGGVEPRRPNGRPLTDPTETTAHRTEAGSVFGTPAYMPPEQARGETDRVDRRADVFGLGALLCAILTGQPPFVGASAVSTVELAARGQVTDAYARLEACGAEPGLVELCKRCLSPAPADRPADGSEVAGVVSALRAEAEQRAKAAEVDRAKAEVRAAEVRKRWRTRMVAFSALLGAALLLTGAVYLSGIEFLRLLDVGMANKRAAEAEENLRKNSAELDRFLVHSQAESCVRGSRCSQP